MADNKFDVYNDNAIVTHTEAAKEDGTTDLSISGLTAETTYDKFSVAYTGQTGKTPIPSFTTAKAAAVLMTSFSLDKTEITGKAGDVVKVTLSNIQPANATNKVVNIGSSDTSTATAVDNGDGTYSITLVKDGTTAAHWVAADGGGAKADLPITISEPSAG